MLAIDLDELLGGVVVFAPVQQCKAFVVELVGRLLRQKTVVLLGAEQVIERETVERRAATEWQRQHRGQTEDRAEGSAALGARNATHQPLKPPWEARNEPFRTAFL